MNNILTNSLLLAAGLSLCPSSAPAQDLILGIKLDGKRVLVEIDGKDVKATVDGKELPDSQIQTKGNLIIVKDSDGEPVANIQRWLNGANLHRIGRSDKAAIGIELDTLSKGLADHLELDPQEVIYVTRAIKGRAAEKAGLRDHDVIVEIEGESPVDEKKLFKVLGEKKPGDELKVRVLRRGTEQDFTIRCERSKSNSSTLWGSTLGNSPYFTHYNFDNSNYKTSMKSAMDALEKLNSTKIEKLSEKDYKAQLEKMQDALKKVQGQTSFTFPHLDRALFDNPGFEGVFRATPKVLGFDRKGVIYGKIDDAGKLQSLQKPVDTFPTNGLDKKLERLEKQFDRLEAMLQRLVEKKKSDN